MRHTETQSHARNYTRSHTRIISALLMLFVCSLTFASNEDVQQPIHIEADKAEISEHQGVMTYSGHVLLSQGGIEVRADTVVVYAKEGELQRITAQGQPVHYRQHRENEKEIKGQSQRMEYSAKSKRLLLLGDAQFWQGDNQFSGNRIQYDPETERVIANAKDANAANDNSEQQRVTVTLQPRDKPQAPPEKKGAPQP